MKSTEMPLAGLSVFVVDDDFYIAEDTRATLEDAGATVLGPFAASGEAIDSLRGAVPDVALVDVNLGFGPDFEVARALKVLGVPTILVTGYDSNIVPDDLAETRCLQKPVTQTMLVAAVAGLSQLSRTSS